MITHIICFKNPAFSIPIKSMFMIFVFLFFKYDKSLYQKYSMTYFPKIMCSQLRDPKNIIQYSLEKCRTAKRKTCIVYLGAFLYNEVFINDTIQVNEIKTLPYFKRTMIIYILNNILCY